MYDTLVKYVNINTTDSTCVLYILKIKIDPICQKNLKGS